jgi:sulfur-oxidizing protein SoxX
MGVTAALALGASLATAPAAWVAVGDGIPQPLGGLKGDATRGAALVADRARSLCLLCHQAAVQGPHAPAALQGNVSTDLRGAGTRWSTAQLRLRVADSRHLNPASPMPTMHPAHADAAADTAARVPAPTRGLPVLSAQELEDIVAWLETQR